MKNSLMSKLRKGIYNGATAVALAASLVGYGCKDGIGPKPLPNCSLDVSPSSGVSPLEVRVKGGCDENAKYSNLMINGQTITTTDPIDTTVVLNQSSDFSLKGINESGNSTTAGPKHVQVLQPSFSQTATVSDSVNIVYNATMNVPQAERKTFRNDSLIGTKTITGPTYSDTIFNAPEGNYYFTNSINSDTAKVTKPSYVTLDTSGLQTDTIEGGVIGFNLASRMHSPGTNPVHLTDAVPLDTITSVQRSGDSVTVTALKNNTGPYSVKFSMKAANGDTGSYVLKGNIHDVPDISGRLESNETQQGVQGTLRAYTIDTIAGKPDTTAIPTTNSDSGNILTDSTGNFSFRINKRSSDLTNILLQARQGTPSGGYQGYVRSISLPAKDTSIVPIMAVPYPTFTSPDNFATFMQGLVGDTPDILFDFDNKYPIFKFQGIEILLRNPLGYGTFTPLQQSLMKSEILDSLGINGTIGRHRITSNQILLDNDTTSISNRHYNIMNNTKSYIIPDSGWVVIVPDSGFKILGDTVGLTETYTGASTVYLLPRDGGDSGVVSREFGHVYLGGGEPCIISNLSVMCNSSTLKIPGPANNEAGMILYQPTFIISGGNHFPYVDVKNVLVKDFK